MTPKDDLSDEDLRCMREIIGAYLELMLEHYARCKRQCLRKSKSPSETTPADVMMLRASEAASKAMSTINYMVQQLRFDKNIISAWLRSFGQDAKSN